jgi:hypothetical protein
MRLEPDRSTKHRSPPYRMTVRHSSAGVRQWSASDRSWPMAPVRGSSQDRALESSAALYRRFPRTRTTGHFRPFSHCVERTFERLRRSQTAVIRWGVTAGRSSARSDSRTKKWASVNVRWQSRVSSDRGCPDDCIRPDVIRPQSGARLVLISHRQVGIARRDLHDASRTVASNPGHGHGKKQQRDGKAAQDITISIRNSGIRGSG